MNLRAIERLGPIARIHFGLSLVREGIAEGRANLEALEREASDLRASLVGSEAALHVVATSAQRARMPRHLAAGETSGTRRLPADARPALTVSAEPPEDAETRQHLARMGLVRTPHPPGGDLSRFPAGLLRRA